MTAATFSPCRKYRYLLSRRWSIAVPLAIPKGVLVVVMLNPSTADEAADDATIRRVRGFAERDGYHGIDVLNLFAFRSTDPASLLAADDPVGPENDEFLRRGMEAAVVANQPVLAAWGAFKGAAAARRIAQVGMLVPGVQWVCLGTTKDGSPRHPLYIRASRQLIPYRLRGKQGDCK